MTQFAIGPALVASANVDGYQIALDATRLASGGYVMTWMQGSDPSTSTAHVRSFDANGVPLSQDLDLGMGSSASVSALADGGFAVIVGYNTATESAIRLQVFGADGAPSTAQSVLTTNAGRDFSSFHVPDVATLSDGRLAAVWAESDSSTGSVRFTTVGEILNLDGTVSTSEFQLGPSADGGFGYIDLDIAAVANGGFALVRDRFDNIFTATTRSGATEVQIFDANGQATTDVISLASVSPNVSVATLPDGDVVIGYGSNFRVVGADGSLGAMHNVLAGTPAQSTTGPVEVAALPDGNLLLTYTQFGKTVAGIYTTDGVRVDLAIRDAGYDIPVVLSQDKFAFVGSQFAHPSNVDGNQLPFDSQSDVLSRIVSATFSTSDADGTPLVNDSFYYARNGDVAAVRQDPDQHYHLYGWQEGRDPNALFSTDAYRFVNTDVREAKIDPLQQYHDYGWREGRDPSASFDTQFYLANNADVRAAGIDPFEHYLQYGRAEGREISAAITQGGISHGSFDAGYYLLSNVDVAKAAAAAGGDNFVYAYQHYQTYGWQEGRNPNALFDTKGYLSAYGDVAAAKIDPLAHYVQYGWHEGRDPSATFDTSNYLAANNDVAAAGIDPLKHFLEYGAVEGRLALGDGLIG